MEPFKNVFNRKFVEALTSEMRVEYPEFDTGGFLNTVFDADWESRELKSRMRHISTTLGRSLPGSYVESVEIVKSASGRVAGDGLAMMVFPDFVEVFGLDYWEVSMAALEQFTQQSSSEFAIRPFLAKDLTRGLDQMLAWTEHESEHVRRLASEGCRSRLPWGMAVPGLKDEPELVLPILERLRGDDSEYVRRSVANNFNDLSKDHPEVVVGTLGRWLEDGTVETDKLVRHGLRTLLKKGNPGAMGLVGLGDVREVRVSGLRVDEGVVRVGESVGIEFEVVNSGDQAVTLMIDYVVDFQLSRGKRGSKVYKLSKFSLGAGERRVVRKAHSFKPITTRTYYSGLHSVAVQVNGVRGEAVEFRLEVRD